MLSDQTIRIVKSTAPVLQVHAETLTRYFYQRMFAHNPEVGPFFNAANQAGGAQQRALAGAICAYAANIDNLEALGGAVELIAHKHASLQIKPEHYPIVGENLLASIREVLGEAATKEVINAWGEAYQLLAGILINREQQIYTENEQKVGGWHGFREFAIDRKQPESSLITSFYLTPVDGGPLPNFLPGQYITVQLKTADGSTTMRNYSLSDAPGTGYFRISVKRETGRHADEPDGYISNKLHQLDAGALLKIGPPCGDFVYDPSTQADRPLVLMAAGVGITPILSILKTALLATPARPVTLIHACLNESVQAFRHDLEMLAEHHKKLALHFRYSDFPTAGDERYGYRSTGFVDTAYLESVLGTRDADYYFCGPEPFMMGVAQTLRAWDIPASQVHFEFFGPRQALERPGVCPVAAG